MPIHFRKSNGLTQPEARVYCPPQCGITKDLTRHWRWKVSAKYLAKDISKCFGIKDAYTKERDDDSLRFVLANAWYVYCKKIKHECPYEFGDFVPLFDLEVS